MDIAGLQRDAYAEDARCHLNRVASDLRLLRTAEEPLVLLRGVVAHPLQQPRPPYHILCYVMYPSLVCAVAILKTGRTKLGHGCLA